MSVASLAESKPPTVMLSHRVGVNARTRAGRCARASASLTRCVPMAAAVAQKKTSSLSSPSTWMSSAVVKIQPWRRHLGDETAAAFSGALGRRGRARAPSSRGASIRAEATAAAAAAADGGGGDAGKSSGGRERGQRAPVVLGVLFTVLGIFWYAVGQRTAVGQAAMGALAKSGFTAAFALIFISELGDKTFFIAALLAMRFGRITVLAGATSALGLMSVISVAIGRIFQQIPSSLTTSLPIGEYLAVALLLFFGVRTLKEAIDTPEATEDTESGELADAAEAVSKSEAGSALALTRSLQLLTVFFFFFK